MRVEKVIVRSEICLVSGVCLYLVFATFAENPEFTDQLFMHMSFKCILNSVTVYILCMFNHDRVAESSKSIIQAVNSHILCFLADEIVFGV